MYYKAVVKERYEIRMLAKIISEDDIPKLKKVNYFVSQKFHVYSLGLNPLYKQIFHVSVWTKPKEEPDSRYVYAGEINLMAFENLRDSFPRISYLDS